MAIEDFYTGTANVLRSTPTKDASGGPLTGYTVIYAAIPVRIEDLGGGQSIRQGQFVIVATHRVFMDSPGDILNGDVIQELTPIAATSYYRLTNPQTRRAIGTQAGFVSAYCEEFAP